MHAAMGRSGGPNTSAAGGEKQGLMEMVQMLNKHSLTPAAVFCFSKKR